MCNKQLQVAPRKDPGTSKVGKVQILRQIGGGTGGGTGGVRRSGWSRDPPLIITPAVRLFSLHPKDEAPGIIGEVIFPMHASVLHGT